MQIREYIVVSVVVCSSIHNPYGYDDQQPPQPQPPPPFILRPMRRQQSVVENTIPLTTTFVNRMHKKNEMGGMGGGGGGGPSPGYMARQHFKAAGGYVMQRQRQSEPTCHHRQVTCSTVVL